MVRLSISMAIWGVSLYGALMIHRVPGDWGHPLCGPWGCGPRVQALVACHTFWLVLLALPAAVLVLRGSSAQLKRYGLLGLLAGVLGLIAIGVWQVLTYLPQTTPGESAYLVQRYLFALATTVELPVLPVTLLGLGLRIRGATMPRLSAGDMHSNIHAGEAG